MCRLVFLGEQSGMRIPFVYRSVLHFTLSVLSTQPLLCAQPPPSSRSTDSDHDDSGKDVPDHTLHVRLV